MKNAFLFLFSALASSSVVSAALRFLLAAFLCVAQSWASAFCQNTDYLVRSKLRQIALGNAHEVRAELPGLLAQHPNDAGVQFLNGTLIADATKALPLFVKIVREYPQSIWADDAQWRVVQIYALRKDTANARSELQTFRKNYPASEFLLFAAEIVKSTVGLPPTFTTYRNPIVVASSAKTVPTTFYGARPAEKGEKAEKPTNAPLAPARKTEEMLANTDSQEGTRFTLQVSVYSSRESAIANVQKLLKARLRSEVLEKSVDGAVRFAVTVGTYSTREAAEKAKDIVQKACACIPFVIAK